MTESDYIIRKLSEDDYNEYYNLINTFRKIDFSRNVFIKLLTEIKLNIWIIEFDDKLIASGTIYYEYKFIDDICKLSHIEDICVHCDYIGKNYDNILMKYLEDVLKSCECT